MNHTSKKHSNQYGIDECKWVQFILEIFQDVFISLKFILGQIQIRGRIFLIYFHKLFSMLWSTNSMWVCLFIIHVHIAITILVFDTLG